MTDNVVNIDFRAKQRERQERLEQIRTQQILKLRAIEEHPGAGKKGLEFGRLEDRMIAARIVGRLVREAKDSGVAIEEIRKRFGRIERYKLDPTSDLASAQIQDKAKGALLKRVRGYLRIAEIVAELTGRDPDGAKIAVLQDTSLWTKSIESASDHSDERASHLALMLRELVEHVYRTTKFAELITRGERVPGYWNAQDFKIEKEPVGYSGSFGGAAEVVPHLALNWDELPALPYVPLIRFGRHEIKADLVVEIEGSASPLRTWPPQPPTEFEGAAREGLIRVEREIGLCMGLAAGPKKASALFETRPHIEVWLTDSSGKAIGPFPYDPKWEIGAIEAAGHGARIFVDGLWRRARMLKPQRLTGDDYIRAFYAMHAEKPFHHPLLWEITPFLTPRLAYPPDYFSWTPVEENHVRHWLDRSDAVYVGPAHADTVSGETWYDRSIPAYDVEISIIDGSLERELTAAVDALRRALDLREREWREGATRTTNEVISRWKTEAVADVSVQKEHS